MTQVSTNGLTDKQIWPRHAVDYDSAAQRNEALTHAAAQMALENSTVSEKVRY